MTGESERYRGRWHLAGTADEPVPGVLLIEPDGALSLEVAGALGNVRLQHGAAAAALARAHHRIVGELENFSSVSLNGCFLRSDHAFSQTPTQAWHVHEAIFGATFSAEEPWAFYGARLGLPGLTRWVQGQSTQPIEVFNEDGSAQQIGVSVPLVSWPLWTVDDTRVDLALRAGTRRRDETITEVEAVVMLRVRSAQLLTRSQLHEVATRPVQVLLGLATGKYTTVARAEVTVADSAGERLSTLPWRWQPLQGNLDADRGRFAFTYDDLSALPEQALAAAIHRLGSIQPVLDLYLASLRELDYAELSFNVVVQALETYHRSRHGGQTVPEALWPSLKDALTQAITDTLSPDTSLRAAREALCQRLDHFNAPSLRQRLKALLDRIEPSTTAICGGNAKSFVQAVVDTRNYYTHWSASLESKALRGGAAVHLTSRLRGLLEILLLRELGFAANSAAEQTVLERRVSWLSE